VPAAYVTGSAASPDLVGVAEVATRSGHPVNTVQSWRRRHADFPRPVTTLATGPVWAWDDVEHWIASRSPARRPGLLRGQIRMAENSDASIEELVRAFEG
jgi:hypothetical protein